MAATASRPAVLDAANTLLTDPIYVFLPADLNRSADRTAGILDETALILDRHGWTQAQSISPEGCYCLLGALQHAHTLAGIDDPAATAWWLLALMARVRNHGRHTSLHEWNDHPSRTIDEVVQLVEDAAEFARTWKAAL